MLEYTYVKTSLYPNVPKKYFVQTFWFWASFFRLFLANGSSLSRLDSLKIWNDRERTRTDFFEQKIREQHKDKGGEKKQKRDIEEKKEAARKEKEGGGNERRKRENIAIAASSSHVRVS